tara:strand:+ start:36826 stop:37713 length:888 start_codon:yes stop_codon:yes gene_type:complete
MPKVLDTIIHADVLDGLRRIPDKSVHLTWTSPPYNVLERSGSYTNNKDNLPYGDYLKWLREIFSFVYDKTVSGGRCAINIDAMTNRQEDNDKEYIRCIYAHIYDFMTMLGWKFRTEICWLKSEAVGKKSAWGSWMSASNPILRRNHEYILVFSKDKWKLDSDIKSDLSRAEFEQYTLSTWNVRAETKKMAGHPAPFSEDLSKRVIKLFSFPQQTVLDPFSGTGTTGLVAFQYDRHYIGIDNSEKYCNYARERIANSSKVNDIDFDDTKVTKKQKEKINKAKQSEEVNEMGSFLNG